MTDYDIKLKQDDLVALFSENKVMANLLESVVNQVLETQMDEHLGADRYEHSDERLGYRNGYRTRHLYSRVGDLTLRVPQTRDGSFNSAIFKRYQRHEQAFVLGLMEMYLQGVSTRKVAKITEALCGVSFSKSTVSDLCVELDARLKAWRDRPLTDKRYPFIIVDALVVDIRRDEAVRSSGVLIAFGVNEHGQREPLDIMLADSENEVSWDELFKRLKTRGLEGVDLVVSDNHTGLVTALKRQFQGALWQRCQVHFMRNILGHTSRHLRQAVADRLRLIFQAGDIETARMLAKTLMNDYETKATKAMDCLEKGLEEALSVLVFPARYQQRLRTTNLAERMNEEIRRRQRVVRIFPNDAAAMRLIGAILAEKYDQWQQASCYMDMTEYWEYKKEQRQQEDDKNTNELTKPLTVVN
jgi:putative transposase